MDALIIVRLWPAQYFSPEPHEILWAKPWKPPLASSFQSSTVSYTLVLGEFGVTVLNFLSVVTASEM